MKNILYIYSNKVSKTNNETLNKKISFFDQFDEKTTIVKNYEEITIESISKLNPDIICFDDLSESIIDEQILSFLYNNSDVFIYEFIENKEFDIGLKKFIPHKFIFTNQSQIKKYISIAKDFDYFELENSKVSFIKKTSIKEKKIKKGFIITFYKTNYNNYEELHTLIKSILFCDYYIILATHSFIPEQIQNLCDLVIFEELNLADQRKYSHGVAETSLIKKSLLQLKDLNINWAFKVSYDIIVNDPKVFESWVLDYKYDFVSCLWGNCIISTNSFFCNVNFVLKHLTFPKTIENMFERSFFIEDIWNQDIINQNLSHKIFTFHTKEEMFQRNVMDKNFYDYNEINFTFNEQEKKFYISHQGSKPIKGKLAIIDFYTENIIYFTNCDLDNYTLWIAPKNEFYDNNLPKNGYYLLITDNYGNEILRKNLDIKDFNFKTKFHKIYKSISMNSIKLTNTINYYNFIELYNFNYYEELKIPFDTFETIIEVNASLGTFTLELLKNNLKKAYLIESDFKNNIILKNCLQTEFIKIIDRDLLSKTKNENSINLDDLFRTIIREENIDLLKMNLSDTEYESFDYFSDENLNKCKTILCDYNSNSQKKIKKITDKLIKNNFKILFKKYHDYQNDDYLDNEIGTIYAYK